MKHLFTRFCLALTLVFATSSYAQEVPSTVIVEHFTNTWCGTCNYVNPTIISTLEKNPNVLHISYHPSSPYAGCTINQSNKAENDDRANYYDVYGSTPRVVIQGQAGSTGALQAGIGMASGQFCSATMKVSLSWKDKDNVTATAVIKSTSASPQTLNAYFGLAEKVYVFASRNGEKEHHDVFRKAFTPASGTPVTLNGMGDSVVLTQTIAYNSLWASKFYSFGILNNPMNKQVVQAGASDLLDPSNRVTSVRQEETTVFSLSPNPSSNDKGITISSDQTELNGAPYVIHNVLGEVVKSGEFQSNTRIDTKALVRGSYTITISGNSKKFVVE